MFNYISVLFLSVFISVNGFSQKERFLQFYGSPFITMFQDANAEFVLNSSPNTLANYAKLKSGEIGLIYRRKFDNNVGWGVGLGGRFDNYSVDYAVIDLYTENDIAFREALEAHFINLYIRKSNLRLQFSYDLTNRIGVGLNLNTYFSTISSPNFNGNESRGAGSSTLYVTPDSSWSVSNYGYNLDIRMRGVYISYVPELFVSVELINGLNFISGVKLAFWGKNKRYFDITTNGVFHPAPGEGSELLHESAITARDVGYYIGFTYDLQLSKRK